MSLRALIGHALQADAHRALARASRFDADQQVAAGELRRLRTAARALHRFAAIFALRFELRAARVERVERDQAAIELGTGTRQRVLADVELARDFGGFLLEALAAHRGFLRAGTLAFELTEQVRVIAMRALDAALRGIAFALGDRELLAAGGELRLALARGFFARRELDAQLLQTLLALEHARMRIAAAVDAQPVAADPLARARDDGFVAGETRGASRARRRAFPRAARARAGARSRTGR